MGDDDEVLDRAVRELCARRGAGLPTLGDALAAAAALRSAADRRLVDLVRVAREEGATWADIGAALGVSAQAAQQRFGRRAEPAGR